VTPERIAELRRLAEAATPGPWLSDDADLDGFCRVYNGRHGFSKSLVCDTARRADCDYLAAANPATLLELLTEIERMHRIVESELPRIVDAGSLPSHLERADGRDLVAEENEKLRADLALARRVLERHECSYDPFGEWFCMTCHENKRAGHAPDCEWLRAMGRTQ